MAKKQTDAEIEERVRQIIIMVGQGWRDGEIRRALATAWSCSTRTIQDYISRARKQMLAQINRPREDLVAEQIARYEELAFADKTSARERLRALERIDKVLGLEAPFKVAPVTPEGDRPYRELAANMPDEVLRAAVRMRRISTSRISAEQDN